MSALTRRRLLALAGPALLAGFAGCNAVGGRATDTETYDAAERLAVRGDTGDVTVRSAERDDIEEELVKRSNSLTADLSKLTLAAEREGGRLTLRSEWNGDSGPLGGRPAMDLDIAVPRIVAVERVETETGSVDVRDTNGDLTVEVRTGAVDVRAVSGTVTAASETGSVAVRDTDALGDVTTTTGSIDAEVSAVEGDTEIRAETGSVHVALGSDLNARLRASVDTGDLNVDADLRNAVRERNHVTGTVGDGGPTLTVVSGTGTVNVTRAGD